MKIIQTMRPRIVPNNSIEYVHCCPACVESPIRPLVEHASMMMTHDDHLLTDADLRFKYCPYCGNQVEIVNVWPTKGELRQLVSDIFDTYGHRIGEEEDDDILREELIGLENPEQRRLNREWMEEINMALDDI